MLYLYHQEGVKQEVVTMTKTEAKELVKQHNNTIYEFDENVKNVANGRETITVQEWFKFSQEKQPLVYKGLDLVTMLNKHENETGEHFRINMQSGIIRQEV